MHADRLRPSPAVRASISTDGLVLLDASGGFVWSSNQVGARIWQLIEQRRSGAEIALQLAGDYGIAHERARGDVAAFVAALVERGLLVQD
ncbi:MAG: PqqD family protein [Acidobacteria bacterium]|nr:PqqD family protein [Acidobacteriota bacterium]